MSEEGPHTGRCYCGAHTISATTLPAQVAICHCGDCRRVSGAAVPAFAAFDIAHVTIAPDPHQGIQVTQGVRRWFCKQCGSPLAATFEYLPGQIYIPVGVLDFAADLNPDLHCHSAAMLSWLENMHELPHHEQSARIHLNSDRGAR